MSSLRNNLAARRTKMTAVLIGVSLLSLCCLGTIALFALSSLAR